MRLAGRELCQQRDVEGKQPPSADAICFVPLGKGWGAVNVGHGAGCLADEWSGHAAQTIWIPIRRPRHVLPANAVEGVLVARETAD